MNRATRGMAARTRWTLAPDSSAILVVEDPAGVENEAIPNGVLFASERTGRTWRMDSVWSVAPSPDWRRLAVGRGVVLRNGESDKIPDAQWTAASRSLSAIVPQRPAFAPDSLKVHAFPISGMTYALGIAATLEVRVDTTSFPITFARMGGWSVAWSCVEETGLTLVTGDRPKRVQDDEPAEHLTPSSPVEPVAWVNGPVLDISAPVSRDSARRFVLRDRVVEQRGKDIVVSDGSGAWRPVGPGVPLAATRGGRFILAVAPRAAAQPFESPDHLVVYRVP